jgi:basic membrane lipoprotein Med (substrate-binding protein (PBP1-ABC) superfamily)
MTKPLRTRFARLASAAAAVLAAFAAVATLAHTAEETQPKTALVIAGKAAVDPALVAKARNADADLRVVKVNADTLGVTLMLAARGYGEVVTVGVDRRTAIEPVARRYPDTRFVVADEGDFERVLKSGA